MRNDSVGKIYTAVEPNSLHKMQIVANAGAKMHLKIAIFRNEYQNVSHPNISVVKRLTRAANLGVV